MLDVVPNFDLSVVQWLACSPRIILNTIIPKLSYQKGRVYASFNDINEKHLIVSLTTDTGMQCKMYNVLFSMYKNIQASVHTPRGVTGFFLIATSVRNKDLCCHLFCLAFIIMILSNVWQIHYNTQLYI